MPCASFESLLLDYEDLSARDQETVNFHLTTCNACRDYFDALVQLDAALAEQYSGIQTPSEFQSRLYARINATTPLAPPSFLPEMLDFIGWSAVIATGVLLLRTMMPVPLPENSFVEISRVLPFLAGLAVLSAAWIGVRVYSDLKS